MCGLAEGNASIVNCQDDNTLARLYKNWSLPLNLDNYKLTPFSLIPFMELATPE